MLSQFSRINLHANVSIIDQHKTRKIVSIEQKT